MTPDNVQKAIDKLEAIDPKDEFAYEKAFMAYKIIKQLPVLIYNFNSDIEVFRARTHLEDIFYSTKSEIALAPHSAIRNFARCNRPFQSKFYCGENRPTSYIELVNYWTEERNEGEKLYVTIGRWKIKRNFSALIITSPDPEKRISKYDREHGPVLDDFLNKYDGDFREANVMLYRYLFERFRKLAYEDPLTYLITSAYCNSALFEIPFEVDAVYYPSVPFNGQGVNFAFNNRFITEDNITLLGAMRDEFLAYTIEGNKKGFRQIGEIVANSIDSKNGTIKW
ncbi:hypothetical protein [Pedobacter sp. SYSU D00535]|uniref:hypothetical protein n=1 Tax=Pedobacter sp. SYSU D00535 TaxID=2810308 RepID=UPI001A973172|nr:hypothetical protein [Pedobacter sp. SYSU D00535]